MVQFLFVLGFAIVFIVFGVSISYFLYSRGAIGRRARRRVARVPGFATQPAFDEDEDRFRFSTGALVDSTSRYARKAVLILLGALVFIVLLIVVLVH